MGEFMVLTVMKVWKILYHINHMEIKFTSETTVYLICINEKSVQKRQKTNKRQGEFVFKAMKVLDLNL